MPRDPKTTTATFSPAMAAALWAGRKTQTRRLATSPLRNLIVGDRIVAREHWKTIANLDDTRPTMFPEPRDHPVLYLADEKRTRTGNSERFDHWGKDRRGMHMLASDSRMTLVVTEIRFQRLQDISEADCVVEGARVKGYVSFRRASSLDGVMVHTDQEHVYATPRCWYRELWGSLHTKDGERWDDNPEVVAVSFEVERKAL